MPSWRNRIGADLAGSLGEAIRLNDRNTESLLKLQQLNGWQWRGSSTHKAERARQKSWLLRLEQHRQNSRDNTCPGNPILLNPVPEAATTEARSNNHRAARHQRGAQAHDRSVDMKERQHRQPAISR